MSKFKTLLFSDFHAKPFDESNPEFSKWEFEMKKYCLDKILEYIKENNITRVIDLGDFFDKDFPKDYELELFDYFWSNVPKEVSKELVIGNHSLRKQSLKRLYTESLMGKYYKEKYNLKVYEYEEVKVGKHLDLFCSHKYINKLQNLNKKYRYIFTHLRASDGNDFFTDEINMTVPKACASKLYGGDIHKQLEFDNVVYCGQSSWVHFPKTEQEESKVKSVPSFLVLDEETGEHKRIELFNENSPYQKKLKHITSDEMFDIEQLEKTIEEMRQDSIDNKAFYKVRIYAKKFLLDKIKRILREKDTKGFIKPEYINLSMNDYKVEQIQFNRIIKECLDNDSVSKSLLEYIKKTNDDPNLEDLIVSTYATLEGFVGEK